MTIPEFDADHLDTARAAGALVIDVREPNEYAAGHVPGAVLVPLGSVPEHVDAFRSAGTTYVVCRSGARSMRACEFLAQQGLDVANVAGGMLAWVESGRAVVVGDQPE